MNDTIKYYNLQVDSIKMSNIYATGRKIVIDKMHVENNQSTAIFDFETLSEIKRLIGFNETKGNYTLFINTLVIGKYSLIFSTDLSGHIYDKINSVVIEKVISEYDKSRVIFAGSSKPTPYPEILQISNYSLNNIEFNGNFNNLRIYNSFIKECVLEKQFTTKMFMLIHTNITLDVKNTDIKYPIIDILNCQCGLIRSNRAILETNLTITMESTLDRINIKSKTLNLVDTIVNNCELKSTYKISLTGVNLVKDSKVVSYSENIDTSISQTIFNDSTYNGFYPLMIVCDSANDYQRTVTQLSPDLFAVGCYTGTYDRCVNRITEDENYCDKEDRGRYISVLDKFDELTIINQNKEQDVYDNE